MNADTVMYKGNSDLYGAFKIVRIVENFELKIRYDESELLALFPELTEKPIINQKHQIGKTK